MRTIAKKELIEFVRDWRTIVAILVIPLLMFPLLFILFPLLLASEAAELEALQVDVVVQTNGLPEELGIALNASDLNITYEPLPVLERLSSPSGDEARLRNGSIDVLVRTQMNGTIVEYALLYISTSEQSLEARSRMFDVLSQWEDNETVARITDAGLDPNETLDPLRWDGDVAESDVATQGEQAGMALSLFIPLVLAVWTFSSAIQPSIDMTAGERERGTLEAFACPSMQSHGIVVRKVVGCCNDHGRRCPLANRRLAVRDWLFSDLGCYFSAFCIMASPVLFVHCSSPLSPSWSLR